jgi:hypothetical protein
MNVERGDRRGSLLLRIGAAWRNALRDILLIVTSILIAFMLDAWWSNTQDRRNLRRHLAALEYEFADVSRTLRSNRVSITSATAATRSILQEMGSAKPQSFADSLAALINKSYDVSVVASQGGALSTILNSGDIRLVRDDSLAYLLAQWPVNVHALNSNNAILTASREQELRQRLIELDFPESAIASNIDELQLPPTRFPLNPNTVLLDPGIESMLVSRLIRLRILDKELQAALDHARKILDRLKQEA